MQYGRFAVSTPGSEKSSQLDRPSQGGCLQPAGRFTHGQNSDFNFHQTLCTRFDLRRAVLQLSFTDRHANRCIAQRFTLDQLTGYFDTVQSFFPAKIRTNML